jgi:hypothetical protein
MELPLEMNGIEPQQDPREVKIGVCFRCGRRGLIGKWSMCCSGYRAATIRTGVLQVPEARSVRCDVLTLRKDPANRKLVSYQRPEYVPYTEVIK